MSIKIQIILTLAVVLATSFNIEATENPYKTKPNNALQTTEKADKKDAQKTYRYGYSKAELRSVPRVNISGHKNPELIDEHSAWASFFRFFIGLYEDDIENARYIFRREIPSLARDQIVQFIDLARAALDGESNIQSALENDKRVLCNTIENAAKSGNKLPNGQIIKMLDEQDQKLPVYYEKVKETLKKELSPQIGKELAQYVNQKTRQGMSMSKLDIAGWAKLKGHSYTYSDLYEGIICPKYTR
jgi:hypothetical protein